MGPSDICTKWITLRTASGYLYLRSAFRKVADPPDPKESLPAGGPAVDQTEGFAAPPPRSTSSESQGEFFMPGGRESFRSVPEGVLETVTPVGAGADPARPLTPRKVEKPWGYEVIWAHTDRYVGKLLFVRAGEAMSLQFHEVKDETLHLLDGQIRLEVGRAPGAMEVCELSAGQSIHLRPGVLHQITAVTDCRILEASTPELDDVVRVRDRYGRAGS